LCALADKRLVWADVTSQSSGERDARKLGSVVPRQQFIDAVDRMIGDAREHEAQIRFWVEAIEFGGADQAVECDGAFATGIGARENRLATTLSAARSSPAW
jgi:hypothetical protein